MIKEYIAYLQDNPKHYWFKARLYGWGWVPVTWQGVLVIVIFIFLIAGNAYRFGMQSDVSSENVTSFILETIFLVVLLMLICFKKGEMPRWNWGIPKKYRKK